MSNQQYGTSSQYLPHSSRDNLTQYSSGYRDEHYGRASPVINEKGYGSYPPPTGYNPARQRSNKRKWWIIGAIVLVLIIAGAVVGGVVGSQSGGSNSAQKSANNGAVGAVSQSASVTFNSNGQPVYASATASAAPTTPTLGSNANFACGPDPWTPSGNSYNSIVPLRPGHPRLFAAPYEWSCLSNKIQNDPYLSSWNATIFANASYDYDQPVVQYVFDGGAGGSGALDIARRVQMRIKEWGYAWRMTNDTRWPQRAWTELYAMSGNDSGVYAGNAGDNWNSQHFLDVAEFALAFAYGYDWMYDAWNATQRTALMYSIISLGLEKGLSQYSQNAFWLTATGNWNCVCNGGLTLAALAILDADPTGSAAQILTHAIPNSQTGCAYGVGSDGTWQETSDYWYFGNQGGAQMAAGLISATGSDQGFFDANPSFNLSGYYHMTSMGFVEKFNWGDCGPNKYTATANPLFLYGSQYNITMYSLYQRDRPDAPDALSMFWYDPNSTGDWWAGLALDHYYSNTTDAWAMMRGSWTDSNQIYAGIKAGNPLEKENHSDLDAGDFVFEALGQRWAGELCQNNYLDNGYFSGNTQSAPRWLYYRCRTDGQNTLYYNYASGPNYGNQLTSAFPSTSYGSTGEGQTALAYTAPTTSAAYFTTDLSGSYGISVKRGMRLVNGRRQMLLQDEITSAQSATMWRMHTNATIAMGNNNQSATLSLGGETLQMILSSPSSAQFTTMAPVRLSTDPDLPSGGTDLPNDGVTVLAINIPAGTQTVEVLFNPQWPDFSSFASPSSVPLSQWSTTSHN